LKLLIKVKNSAIGRRTDRGNGGNFATEAEEQHAEEKGKTHTRAE